MTSVVRQVVTDFAGDGFAGKAGQQIRILNGSTPPIIEANSIPYDGPLALSAREIDMAEVERMREIMSRPAPKPPEPLTAVEIQKKFKWSDEQFEAAPRFGFPQGYRVFSHSLTPRYADVSLRWDADKVTEWAAAIVQLTARMK